MAIAAAIIAMRAAPRSDIAMRGFQAALTRHS
jgi:hypothetical protein